MDLFFELLAQQKSDCEAGMLCYFVDLGSSVLILDLWDCNDCYAVLVEGFC